MNRETMHCPSCGTEISTKLKFCRSCGMSLELVSKAMAEHLSAEGSEAPETETDKRIMQRMVKTMGVGGVIFFIGIVILVIGKKLVHNEAVDLAGTLTLLSGMFIMCYALFSAMLSGASKTPKNLDSADSANQEMGRNTSPQELAAPPPSVTEQTTKILETNQAEKSGKEAGG